MKRILLLFFILVSFSGMAQTTYPVGPNPSPRSDSGFAQYGYSRSLILNIGAIGDTSIRPKYIGSWRFWQRGDSLELWYWTGTRFKKIGGGSSSTIDTAYYSPTNVQTQGRTRMQLDSLSNVLYRTFNGDESSNINLNLKSNGETVLGSSVVGSGTWTYNFPLASDSTSGINSGVITRTQYNQFAAKLGKADSTAGGYYPYSSNPLGYISTISGIAAGGDLSGTYPNPSVVGLRGVGLPSLSTGLLKYNGTSWVMDNSAYITGNQSITLSGDVSGSGTTAITTAIGSNKVTDGMLRQSAGLSIIGRSGSTSGNVADITAFTANTFLNYNGTNLNFAKVPVAGINASGSPSSSNYLRGDGSWSAVSVSPAGSDRQIQFNNAGAFGAASTFVYSSGGNVGIGTSSPTTPLHVVGGDGVPSLSAELINTANYTSTGWTTVVAGTYTHNTGNTTALTNTLAGVVGTGYRILITVTGRTLGTLSVTFGGVTSSTFSPSAGTSYTEIPVVASTTGALSVTPSSAFDGTVTVSIKSVSGNSTAIGILANNSTGVIEYRADTTNNLGIGANALAKNIAGAGAINSDGNNNTAIGQGALAANVSGGNNTGVGAGALAANTSGNLNTGIGQGALGTITTGTSNVAVGSNATGVTTGSYNYILATRTTNMGNANRRVLIGTDQIGTSVGTQTIIIDPSPSPNYSTGLDIVTIGHSAGAMTNTSSTNGAAVNIGAQAGFRMTGGGNVNLGYGAGGGTSTSSTAINSETFGVHIGYQTGAQNTSNQSGTANILIGAAAQKTGLTTSSEIVIWTGSSSGAGGYNAIQWHSAANGGGLLVNNTGSAITTKTSAAALDVQSTTGFAYPPRMTSTQAAALTPVNGAFFYVTDTNATFTSVGFWGYQNGAWAKF